MADQATIAKAREEALETAAQAFAKLDLDGNGAVDQNELRTIAAQMGEGGDAAERDARIAEFFNTFDENGDGKVQLSEWLAFFGNLFDEVVAKTLAAQE